MKIAETTFIDFYNQPITLCLGTHKELCQYILDTYAVAIEFPPKEGRTIELHNNKTGKDAIIIFVSSEYKANNTLALLSHECLHAIFKMLTNCGIDASEELLCILQQKLLINLLDDIFTVNFKKAKDVK